jgi:hypothetical protein
MSTRTITMSHEELDRFGVISAWTCNRCQKCRFEELASRDAMYVRRLQRDLGVHAEMARAKLSFRW